MLHLITLFYNFIPFWVSLSSELYPLHSLFLTRFSPRECRPYYNPAHTLATHRKISMKLTDGTTGWYKTKTSRHRPQNQTWFVYRRRLRPLRLSVPFCQTEVILTSWEGCNKETLLACLGKVRRNSIALSFYYYMSLLLSLDQERDANSGENKLFPRTSQQSQWVMLQGKETCVWASHSLHSKNIFRRNMTQRIDGIQHLYRQGSI